MNAKPTEDLLREVLKETPEEACSGVLPENLVLEHLAPELLTAFLEGSLSADEHLLAEAHLAACPACRDWMCSASEALESPSLEPAPVAEVVAIDAKAFPRKVSRAWAWAAAVVLAIGASLWLAHLSGTGRFDLQSKVSSAGSEEGEAPVAGFDPQLETWLAEARQGSLPELDLFPGLEPRGPEAVLRAGGRLLRLRPLSPRWSRVRSSRPSFIFTSVVERPEIILVDADETLVARIPVGTDMKASTEAGGEFVAPFPETLDPLQAGSLYAWKVGGWKDGEWVASPYVPFQVRSPEEEDLLERGLASAEGDPWREGVVFAATGLLEEALGDFRRGSVETRGEEDAALLRRQLMGEILRRQHFSGAALEEELLRRTSVASEEP